MEDSMPDKWINGLQNASDMEDFEDFEKRVDEVSSIIQRMLSGESVELNENDGNAEKTKEGDEAGINMEERASRIELSNVKKRINKTVVNKPLVQMEESKPDPTLSNLNAETMSQEAFMKAVEADANKRAKEREERKKESDRLMNEGNEAFRNGKYEKALCCYDKAIDARKDNFILYANRALTLLKLSLYTRASQDCDSSLKLRETLKPRLYKGRALFEMGEEDLSQDWMKETRKLYPNRLATIEDYVAEWHKSK